MFIIEIINRVMLILVNRLVNSDILNLINDRFIIILFMR